jgi:glutamate/aspartate transport system substrate-binding protein
MYPFQLRRAICSIPLWCLLFIGQWVGLQSAHAQNTLERIKASGGVVIGHREASVPLSYLADGQPVGYSIDVCLRLAAMLAGHVGVKNPTISYRMVTSATRFDAVEKGEVDLECGSTTNTAERRHRVSFTIPHLITSSRLIVLSSKPYERLEHLDGLTVASTAGTTNIKSLAHAALLKNLNLKIEAAKDHAEGVNWVLSGKVEAFNMDDVLLFGLRASAPRPQDLKVIGKPITIEPYAIAFERGNPVLKQLIDAEMRRLIASKELHQLYDKWFMQAIPPKGINLGMRMPTLLADSLKYPTDFVP